jgi:hypothetical protein
LGFSGKQGALLGFWMVAITATAALLWQEERFLAVGGVPVAQITRTQKDVNYRGENDIRWRRLGAGKQYVYDGDKIATGKQSLALIDFGDGRAANVGADTTMAISSIKQASGNTYILALSKGSVAIKKVNVSNPAIKTQFPIIIRSDGRDYLIEPGDERGVYRDDTGAKEFVGRRQPKPSRIATAEPQAATKIDVPIAVVASLLNESPINLQAQASVVAVPVELPAKDLNPKEVATKGLDAKDVSKVRPKVAVKSVPPVAVPVPPQMSPPSPPAPQAAPPAKAEPMQAADSTGSEIDLDLSAIGREYFSFQSLTSLKGDLGVLRWKESPSARTNINGLQIEPAIELKSGENRKEILLPRNGTLKLKLEDFGDLKAMTDRDGVPCAVLAVRGGSKLTQGATRPNWVFKGEAREINICSYRDALDSLPLVIGLGSLEGEPVSPRPKIFPKPGAGNLKFQMVITTASQLSALFPIVSKNENFRIASTQGMASRGIFIARSGKVVMQLSGPGFNARNADQIREKIGGDIVFKGSRDAILDAAGITPEQLKEMVNRGDAQGRKIYLHKAGNLLPVSRAFLEERKEVASFVRSVASQLFSEKVEVIAYK